LQERDKILSEIERLKTQSKQLMEQAKQLEDELYRQTAKGIPSVSREAEKLLSILEVFETHYPDFKAIAKILEAKGDPTLPKTPEECKVYLKELKRNLSYRIYGRYRRLSILSESDLEEVYAKLRKIFEKNPEKIVWISTRVEEDCLGVSPLIKKMYNLKENDRLVVWTKENPVYLAFRWEVIWPYVYEDDEEKFEELMEGDVILMNPDPFKAIFKEDVIEEESEEESEKDRVIKNFYLRPVYVGEEEREITKLLLDLDIYMPYDDPYVISPINYDWYAQKLLDLLKKKDEETLREIVEKSKMAGLRKMSYIIPKVALDILEGKVYASEKRYFEMSEDAYSPESYGFLYRCLRCATQELSKELKKFLKAKDSANL
jgi:hypothetical protein